MLTRRQMALAPVIKTASERGAEAFGKEVIKALERYMCTVDFSKCATQKDAVDMLYRYVRVCIEYAKRHSGMAYEAFLSKMVDNIGAKAAEIVREVK